MRAWPRWYQVLGSADLPSSSTERPSCTEVFCPSWCRKALFSRSSAAHLLELGVQVLEQVVGLDDEIARFDDFLAQRIELVVGGRGLGSRGIPHPGRGLSAHLNHAPETPGLAASIPRGRILCIFSLG